MFVKVNTIINDQTSTGIIINITQIVLMSGPMLYMSDGREIILTSESSIIVEQAIFPKKYARTEKDEPKPELLELFEQLYKLTGGKGKAVFTPKREKQLKELLTKHRLTKELLIKAATNIGNDKWIQGANVNNKRYGNIDYLLRPEKAAMWSEDQQDKKKGMF